MARNLKEQVLLALLEEEIVSGELLAERFGVTRAAVWKAVDALRTDGFEIVASPNRGYTLGICNRLSAQAIRHYGAGGFELEVLDATDSTNNTAKTLAAQGRRNCCVLAERQTAGRGRMGRSFSSPQGCGLYCSLILTPSIVREDCALLTTYTAVAVAESIEELTGARTGIKWINDIWIGDRKVCGILTEASVHFETGDFSYAVVGIGVNVRRAPFPPELQKVAVSLEEATGVIVDRNRLASAILKRMAKTDEELKSRSYLQRYRSRCFVLGKELEVTRGNERFRAIAVDLSERGELIVETQEGRMVLQSGEVSTKLSRISVMQPPFS